MCSRLSSQQHRTKKKKKKKVVWKLAAKLILEPIGPFLTADTAVLPWKSDWELTEILKQLMRLDIYGFIVPHNLMP